MQRITVSNPVDEQTLASYEQSVGVLRRHFPPTIIFVYAIPRANQDGTLGWWSERQGQPVPISALTDAEQSSVKEKLQQYQEAIKNLATELNERGEQQAADRLSALLRNSSTQECYAIGGEPVLVNWGLPSSTPVQSKTQPIATTKTRYLWPILALLLALLLGWLCWQLGLFQPHHQPEIHQSPQTPSLTELSKNNPSVNLSKKDNFGQIRINLRWEQTTSTLPIDLDIGAFIRLKNKSKWGVEALSRSFGHDDTPPFVTLQRDERSGNNRDGEWLFVNGSQWQNIDEILIYSFIYDGTANWQGTNASVTIYIPDQTPIVSRLTDEATNKSVGVIARLVNVGGDIKVERVDKFFRDRMDVDKAYGWGFDWHKTAGKSN